MFPGLDLCSRYIGFAQHVIAADTESIYVYDLDHDLSEVLTFAKYVPLEMAFRYRNARECLRGVNKRDFWEQQ